MRHAFRAEHLGHLGDELVHGRRVLRLEVQAEQIRSYTVTAAEMNVAVQGNAKGIAVLVDRKASAEDLRQVAPGPAGGK